MSVPACVWASEKGRELKLTCPERVVLWQLAERANCKGFCWPSVVQIMDDTGLARQTVLTVVHGLAGRGLIRIEKQGQRHIYYVLRHLEPVQNKTGQRSKFRPATGLNQDLSRSKSEPAAGLKAVCDRSKSDTQTGLKSLPEPLKEPIKEPRAREDAREPEKPGEDSRRKESEANQPVAPPPEASPKAPLLGTTTGGTQTYIPARSSDAFLDDPSPDDALPKAEADPLDAPVDPAKVRAVVAEIRHATRMKAYPPRESPFSRDEQMTICEEKPRIRTAYLPDEVLRAQRLAFAARSGGATWP